MPHKLTGYRWEGAAGLVTLAAAWLTLYFGGTSPIGLVATVALSLLGACFMLSYMRTWRRSYRNIVLAILLISAVAFYRALLLPSR
jgi:glucan phosphoethanolaminetransferase (alkaline phosphatase superfamily)